MPENWNIYKLGDLIEHQKGFAFKSKWYQSNGAIIVRVSDTTDNSIDVSTCNKIDKDLASAYERFKIQFNDIVIATVGSWPPNYASVVGKVIKVPPEADGSLLNQNAVRLRSKNPEKFDQKFIYYLMKSNTFLKYIVHSAQGSANQASIKLTDIFNFSFSLPKISEQKSIASILSSLDDKIELNLQMNKTLEEMAMALYKHWFVDFGPFQDGEFVDSELGEIPKGWEVKSIGELYNTTSGGTPSRKKSEYYEEGTINWVKSKELYSDFIIDTEEKINHLGLKKSSAKLIPPKSVLLAMYGATVGESSILSIKATCNQAICAISEKGLSFIYVFLYLRIFKTDILNQATGSAQQNISQQIIKNISIISPPVDLQVFKELEQYYALIEHNVFENQTLTQLRDTLLPKLISGEVRVKDVEKTLTEVL